MSLSGGWVTSTPDTEATSTCSRAENTDTTMTSVPSSPRSSPCVVSGTCSSTREDASTSPPLASEWHLLNNWCCCSQAALSAFYFSKQPPQPHSPISNPFLNIHHRRSIPEERQNESKYTGQPWLTFYGAKNKHVVKNLNPPCLDYVYSFNKISIVWIIVIMVIFTCKWLVHLPIFQTCYSKLWALSVVVVDWFQVNLSLFGLIKQTIF